MKSAGRVTVVRTLGLTGYTPYLIGIQAVESGSGNLATAGGSGNTWAVLHPTQVDSDAQFGVKFNDGTPEQTNLYLYGAGSILSKSFAEAYFALESPDPAGGANQKYGFYFTGSIGIGTQNHGNNATAQAALNTAGTVFNTEITIPATAAAGGAVSASIINVIRNAINSVTASRVSGVTLFSASLAASGSHGSAYKDITDTNSGKANSVRILNKFTGDVAAPTNGFGQEQQILQVR